MRRIGSRLSQISIEIGRPALDFGGEEAHERRKDPGNFSQLGTVGDGDRLFANAISDSRAISRVTINGGNVRSSDRKCSGLWPVQAFET